MKSLLVTILSILFIGSTRATKSFPVTTLLNAKWNVTPVYLEISEFLYDDSPNLYWDYVNGLISLPIPLHELNTDSKVYKSSVDVAEKLIGSIQLPLLKLALSMRTMSPRVQVHFQIAREVIEHGDCKSDTFITIGSRVACDFDELKKGIEKAKKSTGDSENGDDEDVYSFDHIYPGSENNTITAVLYSELGSKDFKTFHEYLVREAESGAIKYICRHFIRKLDTQRVRLSGYGVELHLKSTEYKSQDDSPRSDDHVQSGQNDVETENEIEGFDFNRLKERYPSLAHSLDRLRGSLLEKSDEIAPLKAWEFQDLGLQAAERVAQIQGEESLQILQFTAQNFPIQAKSLLHVRVSDDFRKEMKHNTDVLGKELNFQPPDAALYVNGLYFDAETVDVGTLVETLRAELRVLSGLHKLKIHGSVASELLTLDLSQPDTMEFAIDVRDSAVNWMNDIENDHKYRGLPPSVFDLLRPSFPGMLRSVRKNLFNLVIVIDPIVPDARDVVKLVESFVVHGAPIRVGVVFDARKGVGESAEIYRTLIRAWNYISQTKNPKDALSFLTDLFSVTPESENVKMKTIKSQFKQSRTELDADQVDDILSEDSDYDYGLQLATEFVEKLGYDKSPQALMNGVPLDESVLSERQFEEAVLSEMLMRTMTFQRAVSQGQLDDNVEAIDYVMNQPNVMPRLNQRIMTKEDPVYLDLTGEAHTSLENIKLLAQLSARDMTATLLHNLKYFTSKGSEETVLGKKISFLTLWIVTDLTTSQGIELLQNALTYMKSSSSVRIAFIPNTEGIKVADRSNLNRLVWSAMNTLPGPEATNIVLKWLQQEPSERKIPSAVQDILSESELHMKMLRVYSQRVLQLKASQNAVVSNGKVLGPLKEGESFVGDDFALTERLHNYLHGEKIRTALKKYDDIEETDSLSIDDSDLIMKLVGLLAPRQTKARTTIPKDIKDAYSVVSLAPKKNDAPYIEVFAALDPASRGAQKLAPILILLREVVNCNMRVVLSAVEKHSDMPVKNFYRFVIEPELNFQPDGKLSAGPLAKFVGLPASPLLTQNLQAPENWLVDVVRSVYDLDNIKLVDINGPVHSEYELEYLLLEGHCFDSSTGSPPRGLQVTLGTKDSPTVVDTIVMANLGYFQLKANPGAWILRLRHGKSEEIYDITSADGTNTIHSPQGTRVIISSFRSHVIKLRVTKKRGKEQADLLSDDEDGNSGIWNSITSSFSSASSGDSNGAETINIFSVASGHLYERLLRIMMLSLLKHTKSPVKFWFLKNYLSPQFIDFLPHMAKEYHFQYELVQYKWPRWLHQQTEKQRTIWGYKILFLDVLFPLDVKKIIFVDADAIVRTDIKELNEMDLGGAPYAYTPFCDSRKDMEGFRFWKLGYWRNHLQHRKYHISALYVVDLKRFRKVAAGDRLRGQYQALSQDPNSLANLDQDLPNNMIHQVAIKSLPQEWLYCQTWCSEKDIKNAKVIDLCNNPMTKEAKLTAAQRIVPEWKDYDAEIKNLMIRVENEPMMIEEPHDSSHNTDEIETDATEKADDSNKHTEL